MEIDLRMECLKLAAAVLGPGYSARDIVAAAAEMEAWLYHKPANDERSGQ